MIALTAPVQSVLYALTTKSVGSAFRIKDDWNAPPSVRENTLKREGALLGLSTVVTTIVQLASTPLLKKIPGFAKYELIGRALLTAPALVVAEMLSRDMAPKKSWRPENMMLPQIHPTAINHDHPEGMKTLNPFASAPILGYHRPEVETPLKELKSKQPQMPGLL